MNYYLLHFFSDKQSRKPAVIRQILSNKKTSSSLYWGMRYQLLDYLNVIPTLNTEKFNMAIKKLIQKDLLIHNDNELLLSEKGIEMKNKFDECHYKLDHPELFLKINYSLWNALMLLMIQVSSEYSYQNKKYYVASNNLQAQFLVKQWINKFDFEQLRTEVKDCLMAFLKQQDELKADIFSQKLIGHDYSGLSNDQIAHHYNLNTLDVDIIFHDLAVQFAYFILSKKDHLSLLVQKSMLSGIFSDTIKQTKELFDSGLSLKQIVTERKLKISTIQEHIEILAIIEKNFPYNKFINENEVEYLDNLYQGNIDKWQFNKMNEDEMNISFFKFRLFCIMRSHDEQRTK